MLLIVAMLTVGFTVPSTASELAAVNGAVYTVVTTEEELVAALQAGENVMLANDIELTTTNFPQGKPIDIASGIIIDGNGYTLTYPTRRGAALFNFKAGTEVLKGTVNVRNINFGTKDAPIEIFGVDGLFRYATDLANELIFENVNFYVKKNYVTGNSGAIFATLGTVAHFRGCVLDVDMTNVTGGSLHGGWFGEISANGRVEMDDCTTMGTIVSPGGAAGFVGQNTAGALEFYNCRNLANVTATLYAAGFVANMGMGCVSTYAADCINYGNITSTDSGYDGIAGGIFARISNRATISNFRLHVVYRCANYGKITAANVAGGIMGRNHDHDYDGRSVLTLGSCENFGTVKGTSYAGGIVGMVTPTVYAAELIDCVNLGMIVSGGYAGNFAGLLSGGASINDAAVRETVIDGGYAAGAVFGASDKTGAIAGTYSGSYSIDIGPYAGKTVDVVAPEYSNVTYFGTLTTVPTGVQKADTAESLLTALSERLGTEVIEADASDRSAYVVLANPVLRGIQLGQVKDGKLSIRLAAGVYAKDAYQSFGFDVTVTNADGTTATKFYQATETVTTVEETVGSEKRTVKAENVAAKYLYTAVVSDVDAIGRATVQVTPVAIGKDGTKTYTGSTKLLAVVDGKVTNETMSLNGVLLENFAIVYKSTNTMAEKTLATHLSQRIAELTGISLPVMVEKRPHNRTYTINVGTVAAAGEVPAGRNISPLSDAVSIVISGDTTARLGEAVQHFIDLLEEKVVASNNALYVSAPIAAPAKTEVSIMSFNMGATDKGDIKAGEWDLLVEYLPDIFTAQEPWAGFLDDFCNNYAVRPTTEFKASTSDDDVMESDVNNKAFTGNDYYGIYWGMPRWTPDGPNANQGKASYSVIFYAKDRFTVNEEKSGTFMFSDTPDVIGSKLSKSSMPRCATYLTLTDVNTGKEFVVVNVHLDHVNGQVEQATILVDELIKRVGKDTPMLVTGDMNSRLDSAAIQHMMTNETMPLHSFDYLSTETYWSDNAKFHVIDWIFTNTPEKLDVSYYRFCNDFNMFYNNWTSGKLQMYMPSDHPAIYCEFSFR